MQHALTLYWGAHSEEIDLNALRLIDLSLELVTPTNGTERKLLDFLLIDVFEN